MALEMTAAQWAMASFAVTAASAVNSYVAGNQQADAANKSAWDNYYANKAILDQQALEISQDATNQESERAIQARIEQAKIRALAGESGVAGNTVDAQLKDSVFQESKDIASIETNRANRLKQNANENKSIYSRANATATEAENKRPSLLGTGLQIAGSYANYQSKTKLPSGKS